jgi:hypothetical protein
MPLYDYFCEANNQTVEVVHSVDKKLNIWAEVCYYAQIPLGDTDPEAPVKRVIRSAPGVSVPKFNSELKDLGFTKLEKRDDGVYENMTATDKEKRYMKRGDPTSLPDFKSKIGD